MASGADVVLIVILSRCAGRTVNPEVGDSFRALVATRTSGRAVDEGWGSAHWAPNVYGPGRRRRGRLRRAVSLVLARQHP